MNESLKSEASTPPSEEKIEAYSQFVDLENLNPPSVTKLIGALAVFCEYSMVELCKYRERAEHPESEFTDKDIQNAMDHRSRVNAFRDIFRYLGQEHILMEAEERAQIIANLNKDQL